MRKLLKTKCKDSQKNPSKNLLDDYEKRCCRMREMVIDLATGRLLGIFRERAQRRDHGLPDCHSLEDYLNAYKTCTPLTKEMRACVFFLTNDMWTKEILQQMEKDIMKKMMLKYIPDYVDPEKKHVANKLGGCIGAIISRVKQTLIVDRFR